MKIDTTVVKLKGGMGNQMFQYAFGRALEESAKQHGTPITLLFDTSAYTHPIAADTKRPYYLDYLHTRATIASDTVVQKARNPYGIISKVVRRALHKLRIGNSAAFEPSLLHPPYKRYYEGYWQTEKYFLPVAEQIHREFTFKVPLQKDAAAIRARITADQNAVSIFYRRTDYVGDARFDIGEQAYQMRAIARMQELVPGCRLYVMSDDINWVRAHASLPADSVFVSSPKEPGRSELDTPIAPHEEMQLMSACQHHIIPNSTFAWWGAWLNNKPNKIVIAPKQWTRDHSAEYEHIIPESWIQV